MKYGKLMVVAVALLSVAVLAGCGVSKDKYDAVTSENAALKEKAAVLVRAKDALKKEYDNLLKEKMDLAIRVETAMNEKNALKAEYDKILDEKVTLQAAHDKLIADSAQQVAGEAVSAPAAQQ